MTSKRRSGGWAVTIKDAARHGLVPLPSPYNAMAGLMRWSSVYQRIVAALYARDKRHD